MQPVLKAFFKALRQREVLFEAEAVLMSFLKTEVYNWDPDYLIL
jgi:hypothetical protein